MEAKTQTKENQRIKNCIHVECYQTELVSYIFEFTDNRRARLTRVYTDNGSELDCVDYSQGVVTQGTDFRYGSGRDKLKSKLLNFLGLNDSDLTN